MIFQPRAPATFFECLTHFLTDVLLGSTIGAGNDQERVENWDTIGRYERFANVVTHKSTWLKNTRGKRNKSIFVDFMILTSRRYD